MGDHTGGAGRGARVIAGRTAGNADSVRYFRDDEDAIDFMQQEYGDQTDGMSDIARGDLYAYTVEEYERINEYLRGVRKSYVKPVAIDGLDEAFAQPAAVLRHNLVVVRDVGKQWNELLNLQPGDTFTDAGFVSTSVLPRGTPYFMQDRLVKIKVHAGARAIWVAPIAHYGNDEGELLIKRGTTFEVIKPSVNGSALELEVIGQM